MSMAVQITAAARVMVEQLGRVDIRELADEDADEIYTSIAKQFRVDTATVKATLLQSEVIDPDDIDKDTARAILKKLSIIATTHMDDHLAARVGLGLLEHRRSRQQHSEKMKVMQKQTAPVVVINNLIQQAFRRVNQFQHDISDSDAGGNRVLPEASAVEVGSTIPCSSAESGASLADSPSATQ